MDFIPALKSTLYKGTFLLGVVLLIVACRGEVRGVQPLSSPSPNPIPLVMMTSTPAPPSPLELRRGLYIWLPPQFDPHSEQPAARLLSDRLQAFYEQFPNLPIEIRLKAEEGPGGMLEALIAASEAAPLALPDLVLLPRELVVPLAQRGILHPMNEFIQLSDEQEWYPYARQLAMVENTPFGIPFVGDVLLLAYPQSIANELPLNWNDWLISHYSLGFPAADPRATVILALYLQAGGAIRNAQGKLSLDEDVLTELLENLSYASRQGKFPQWVTQAENDQLILQSLTAGRIDSGYLWGSSYLKNNSQSWRAAPGFLAKKTSLTLADGWIWVSTSPIPDKIGISFQLASFLSAAKFMSIFASAMGYMPTQPEAFTFWEEDERAKELDTISNLALVIPPNHLSEPLGITLRNATLAVLKDRISPSQAAKDAIANLNKP